MINEQCSHVISYHGTPRPLGTSLPTMRPERDERVRLRRKDDHPVPTVAQLVASLQLLFA
ncbi:hypothetical protein DC522_20585 [Microvirga sp. KLBC 81]|nr:hypothetical protein DC522_20585 [Microvirga sp. KLBC 81]